jgi:hypothetical protein
MQFQKKKRKGIRSRQKTHMDENIIADDHGIGCVKNPADEDYQEHEKRDFSRRRDM